MSPRDALKRMTAGLASHNVGGAGDRHFLVDEAADAHGRLAQILAEVEATPVENFFPQTRTQPSRDPAQALSWFILTDAAALAVSFVVAWIVAAWANVYWLDRSFPFLTDPEELMQAAIFGATGVGMMMWFSQTGHYRQRMPFWSEMQLVVNALCIATLVNGFCMFVAKQDFSRLWLMSGWLFAGLFIMLSRSLARYVLRKAGLWQVRTLLVGSGAVAEQSRMALRSERRMGYDIAMQIENLPLLLAAANGSWKTLCDRFNADYVVIALEGAALVQADDAIAALVRTGIPFSVSPPLRHMPVLGMAPQYFFNNDTMFLSPANKLEQALPRSLKRAIDIIGSGLALAALSPLFIALMIGVKLDGGPAFFHDLRVGRGRKAFYCLKFRSMVVDGDKVLQEVLAKDPAKRLEWETYHKLRDGDPRVTKIGSFLRKWSIDELPQLINVFIGDMSLVGPRPIMFRERAAYSEDIAHYYRVRPGLTGLWQVSGRSDVSFARRVHMDCWYVRNWSLWHDIAILFKTIPVVFKRTGAY